MLWINAFSIWVFEKLLDEHVIEINELKLQIPTGTDIWYAEQSKLFQLGDSLVWNGLQFEYEIIDDDKKIIVFSSAITVGNTLKVKVAKANSTTGLPEKLSVSELTSFNAYITDIAFSGTDFVVISTDGDLIKLAYTIFYNPLVLNSDGSSILNPSQYPVEDAINNYLSNLDFNGILRINDLTDSIQAVSGVVNPVATVVEAKPYSGTYTDILNSVNQSYIAFAGYSLVDPAYPLTTQLTYTVA